MGTVLIKAQVLLMYWVTAALKSGPEWFPQGTALAYAFQADHIVLRGGEWLLAVLPPVLLQAVTLLTWLLEWLAPVGLLLPVAGVRLAAVLLLVCLHLGIALTLNVHWFPWINIVALLPFVPGTVWDVLKIPYPLSGRTVMTPVAWLRRLGMGAAAVSMGLVLWMNLAAVFPVISFHEMAYRAARLGRLDQYWAMFAPHPMKKDGWYLVKGKLQDGTFIDLFSGQSFSPAEIPGRVRWAGTAYTRFRWQKYLENLIAHGASNQYEPLVAYWCNSNPKISELAIFFRQSPLSPDPTSDRPQPQYFALGRYDCR